MTWPVVAAYTLGVLTCLGLLTVTALIAVSPWGQERLARRVADQTIAEAAELANAKEQAGRGHVRLSKPDTRKAR